MTGRSLIDAVVNKALLDEIDQILQEMGAELLDCGVSPRTFTREQVDHHVLKTIDLGEARDDILRLYEREFAAVKKVREHHPAQTWINFKSFNIKGLPEQKLLKIKQDEFKKAFTAQRPSMLFKLKAGSDGSRRKA